MSVTRPVGTEMDPVPVGTGTIVGISVETTTLVESELTPPTIPVTLPTTLVASEMAPPNALVAFETMSPTALVASETTSSTTLVAPSTTVETRPPAILVIPSRGSVRISVGIGSTPPVPDGPATTLEIPETIGLRMGPSKPPLVDVGSTTVLLVGRTGDPDPETPSEEEGPVVSVEGGAEVMEVSESVSWEVTVSVGRVLLSVEDAALPEEAVAVTSEDSAVLVVTEVAGIDGTVSVGEETTWSEEGRGREEGISVGRARVSVPVGADVLSTGPEGSKVGTSADDSKLEALVGKPKDIPALAEGSKSIGSDVGIIPRRLLVVPAEDESSGDTELCTEEETAWDAEA